MLFNSLTFVVFFALVVTAYWSIAFLERAQKPARGGKLHFLRGVESAFRCPPLFYDGNGFLARPRIARAKGHSRRVWLIASVCMNLSMLGFFKYGNFLLQNFQWLLGRDRHCLPTAASGHPPACRHFLLHVSFSLLHARHLSRRAPAHKIAARFRPGCFLFPTARCRSDCAGR